MKYDHKKLELLSANRRRKIKGHFWLSRVGKAIKAKQAAAKEVAAKKAAETKKVEAEAKKDQTPVVEKDAKTKGKSHPSKKKLDRIKRHQVEHCKKMQLKATAARTHRAKLRKSLRKGTVVIILTGTFKGRRAIFLKQLKSGLCLITGPYALNGVPLRRINQRFLIATHTRVALKGVKIPHKFNDKYFARITNRQEKKNETNFFSEVAPKKRLAPSSVADIAAFDKLVMPIIEKVPFLPQYLKSTFSLRHGERPHLLKF
ncbi:60S ribosomal protein L6-3 [Pelomyxa schiedti]|nr:60S ribosomal protein L6-3 [Pelomyxa schiedti]